MTRLSPEFFLHVMKFGVSHAITALMLLLPLKHLIGSRLRFAVIWDWSVTALAVVAMIIYPAIIFNIVVRSLTMLVLYFLVLIKYFWLTHGELSKIFYCASIVLCVCTIICGFDNFISFLLGDDYVLSAVVETVFLLCSFSIAAVIFVPKLRKNIDTTSFEKTAAVIPLMLFFMTMMSGNFQNMSDDGEFVRDFFSARILILIGIFTFSSMLEEIHAFKIRLSESQAQARQLEMYASLQRDIIDELSNGVTEQENLRRRLSLCVQQISQFAEQKDFAKVREILAENAVLTAAESEEKLCGNPAVNALACWYRQVAQDSGIDIHFSLNIPRNTGVVGSVDLCRIVGNMLENAIEASLKIPLAERKISFSAMPVGNSLVLILDNSFDGQATKNGQIFLSKKRSSGHGIGLSSIKKVAERYHGQAQFNAEGDRFSASVSLYMKEV